MLKKEEKYFARFEKFEKTSFSDLDFDRNEAEKREKKKEEENNKLSPFFSSSLKHLPFIGNRLPSKNWRWISRM